MIRRPRYIYSIVPQRRINHRQALKISILVIMGLMYFNKHYYIKAPQDRSLIGLFGLDKPEPNPYWSNTTVNLPTVSNTPQEAYIPKNYSDIPKLSPSKTSNVASNAIDSIKIKTESADTVINVKGLTSSLPHEYNVRYVMDSIAIKDSTTNVVFTGAFQNRDNAERILKRLKAIGYDKAEIIMKEGLPYSIVVSGFYFYKSSAKAEVRALQRRGIEAYKAKKEWADIYRK